MFTVANEFAPSVAPDALLNLTVNDSEGSTIPSSMMVMLMVWLPYNPLGQVNVPLAAM